MGYQGEGSAKPGPTPNTWVGLSNVKFDNAIRAAVHFANCPDGTKFEVTKFVVTSKGDPNIGGYRIEIARI